MPFVHIEVLEGRTVEQKRTLAKKITQDIVEILDTKPEKVRIVFTDMKHHDYALAGVLHCDAAKS